MIDYVQTFRRLEEALAGIEESASERRRLSGILVAIVGGPGQQMGISGGRLYGRVEGRDEYELIHAEGRPALRPGLRVKAGYGPIARAAREGLVVVEGDDPDFDPTIEGRLGVERFAAISVGEASEHIVAFTLEPVMDAERAVTLLATARHVINLKLAQEHMLADLAETQRIQQGLLPRELPDFHGFEFAARTRPAEDVGGDLYDFLRLSDEVLGVAIGDSCGHGLPAALMARDVMTGLRCVLDVHYRLTRAIAKVNQVVARSSLASRFISLFYAEFETNGNLVYCNAGHPPALLWRRGRITRLRRGGPVLGPLPGATYERGFERFAPGSILLLVTDGIVEAGAREGRPFGSGRLERLFREQAHRSAEDLATRVMDEVARHAPGPPDDDRTVVVVKRPG